MNKTQQARKEAGLCIQCGRNPAERGVRCKDCAEKHNLQSKNRYNKLTWFRYCPNCKKKLPEEWFYVLCPECTELYKERQRKQREAKRGDVDYEILDVVR